MNRPEGTKKDVIIIAYCFNVQYLFLAVYPVSISDMFFDPLAVKPEIISAFFDQPPELYHNLSFPFPVSFWQKAYHPDEPVIDKTNHWNRYI